MKVLKDKVKKSPSKYEFYVQATGEPNSPIFKHGNWQDPASVESTGVNHPEM